MAAEEPGDVAVIVTSHNYARYLDDCLKSILEQTLPPREVILVDDASEDATSECASAYPGVVYYRVDYGNGNRARNFGFDQISAPFVVFFDADNVMEPRFLEVLLAEIRRHPGAAFAYCDRENVGEGDVSWYPEPMGLHRSRPFDRDALRRANYIDLASVLRSDRFPGFDGALRRYQDWDLWLNVVLSGGEGRYVPESLYRYRVHDASLTRREDADEAVYRVRRKHLLGSFFRLPLVRDSFAVFRALRRIKRLMRTASHRPQ